MSENSLALRGQMHISEALTVAEHMARSGFFSDAKQASQAVVKVLAGQELGLGPFASMTGVHIIQGRPSLGANLIATLIKNDPRYDYRVLEMTDDVCTIRFFECGQPVGDSAFTAQDARKAGTKNMDKFPRNMLFARAISNGARWYAPGVFGGAPVYTPEELGADIDEDGYVVGEVVQGEPEIPTHVALDSEEQIEVALRECASPTRFFEICCETIARFELHDEVRKAMKQIGYSAFPAGTKQADERVSMYETVAQYAGFLDAGLSVDDALASLDLSIFATDDEEE